MILAACKTATNEKESASTDSSFEYMENLTDMGIGQKSLRGAEKMLGIIENYQTLDFRKMAEELDAELYSFSENSSYVPMDENTYAPIGYWDDTGASRSFGIPSYIGHYSGNVTNGTVTPGTQEGVTVISSVLGSSLAGKDKSDQNGYDFVDMLKCFYNKAEGVVLNRKGASCGASFWYDLYPQIQYARIYDLYKDRGERSEMKEIVLSGARKWLSSLENFKDKNGIISFDFSGYSFQSGSPVSNGIFTEPPHAAIAYVLYSGYKTTDDEFEKERFKEGMKFCMDALDVYPRDYSYEVIQDFSPYVAAIMNREFGTNYDVEKMLNNIFDGESDTRRDFGMITGDWNGYNVNGMIGQDDYIFLMNVYNLASVLAPLVKYDARYATAIGRWFLNASDHVKLFYPNYIKAENQYHGGAFSEDKAGVIAYESVRKSYDGKSPYAIGDPTVYGWGQTNYGLYGSVQVGVFASIIGRTNVEQVLKIDLNACDFYGDKTVAENLYYNPYNSEKAVKYAGNGVYSLVDILTGEYLAKNVCGETEFTIDADTSRVIAEIHAGEKVVKANGKLFAGESVLSEKTASVSVLYLSEKYGILKGKINFVTRASETDGVRMKIMRNNSVIYDGDYSENHVIDTALLPDGRCELRCEIITPEGLTDRSSVRVDICNRGDKVTAAHNFTQSEMLGFTSNGSLKKRNGGIRAEKDGTLVIKTPEFDLDLDRLPRLNAVIYSEGYFDINVVCSDINGSGRSLRLCWYDHADGELNYDIKEGVCSYGGGSGIREYIKGMQRARLELVFYGENGKSVADIERVSIDYPVPYGVEFTAADYRSFVVCDTALFKPAVIEVSEYVKIRENNRNGTQGNALSPYFLLGVDSHPYLNVGAESVYGTFTVRIVVGGRAYELFSTTESGSAKIDINAVLCEKYGTLPFSNVVLARVDLMVRNKENAYVVIKELNISYE